MGQRRIIIPANENKVKRPIGLAALTVLELSPPNQVTCAAEAGYSHVGLRLLPATPSEAVYPMVGNTPMVRETQRRLAETGIKVLDIEILRLKPDTRAINFLPVLETGARFGASQVLMAGNDPDPARLADNFAQVCELAAPLGLAINIEPMPWTDVRNIKDAAKLMKAVNRSNAGVLIDALHFDRGGNTLSDLSLLPKDSLRYMQLCDGTKERPTDVEGMLHQARAYRLSPGKGGINLVGLLKALPPELPISIECVDEKLSIIMSPLDRARMYRQDAVDLLKVVEKS
jgi:sugar phosphate isomerase/epimerase